MPRLQGVIAEQSQPGGLLHEFNDITTDGSFQIIDISQFGIPQKRKRCIGGNFSFELLNSYRDKFPTFSLGDVLTSLHVNREDPVFPSKRNLELTDMDNEEYFTSAEI